MWWDSTYPLRRNLEIIPPITGAEANQPVTFDLPAALNDNDKILNDGADLQVLFLRDNMWLALSRQIIWGEDDLPDKLTFALVEDIDEPNLQYYVYHGKPVVEIPPVQASFDPWYNTADLEDFTLTFTRPGEHWEEGVSSTIGARATLQVYANQIRLLADVGPDQGVIELQLNEGAWEDVDLYASVADTDVVVWSKTDLEPGFQQVIVRVSGRSNTGSSSYNINIKSFKYMKSVDVVDLGEEIDEGVWTSVLGGS